MKKPEKRLIVGNWKMNPQSASEAKKIAKTARQAAAGLSKSTVVICPPFVFLTGASSRSEAPNFHLGAQSLSFHESGAHTGEVSAGMLKDLGAEYAIIGHSETRQAGDTDENVSKRLRMALDAGLKPILCVGEKVRDDSGSQFDFLREQIKGSLAGTSNNDAKDLILAYEPVWAIGAKEPMKPEDIREMAIFVKKVFSDIFGGDSGLKVPVLYGGAVNFRNAADIIQVGQVDGLLVGRESVSISGFAELLKAVDEA
ncbi:triose-phosphate isomerase [Patescibacteria group bacterium]|nr:triose-phosphate isomerase [Patescibacteria group bacterium]